MNRCRQIDRRGKTLLIGLVVVFLALAVAVVWMWRSAPSQPDLDEGRAVADAFLNHLRTGKAPQAWDSTTTEFKSAQGRESFVEFVKENAWLAKPLQFVSVQTVTVQDSPRAEYLYRSAEAGKTVRLLAGDEDGTWRIDRVVAD